MIRGKYTYMMLIVLLAGLRSAAQDYFYKVYEYETPLKGHVELQLRNSYIPTTEESDGHSGITSSRKDLFAHSAEIGFGVTDHLELDAYADFLNTNSKDLRFIQSHFSALYRFGQRYDHFINTGVYLEYYIPASSYSNSQEAELRLIMDKDIGDMRLVLNPTVSKYTTGTEDRALQPGLNAGMYYRRFAVLQPGVEYFANFKNNRSVIFPAVNIFITPQIIWNLGAGFGLTPASDRLVVKSMLQFDVQAIRPSKLMGTRHRPMTGRESIHQY